MTAAPKNPPPQNTERLERIRTLLKQRFSPVVLEVADESHRHAGHAGARGGAGHFKLTIVSEAFADQPNLKRHRMIYAALGDMMPQDIHALAIEARTPAESQLS